MEKHIYKPLPIFLTIRESNIHGLGLFTKEQVLKGTLLGISHVHSSLIPGELIDVSFSCDEHNIKEIVLGNHLSSLSVENNASPNLLPLSVSIGLDKSSIFPNGMIRTPLGGFINHSENDNCDFVYLNSGLWGIITREDIPANTELTLNYSLTPCGVIKANTD